MKNEDLKVVLEYRRDSIREAMTKLRDPGAEPGHVDARTDQQLERAVGKYDELGVELRAVETELSHVSAIVEHERAVERERAEKASRDRVDAVDAARARALDDERDLAAARGQINHDAGAVTEIVHS